MTTPDHLRTWLTIRAATPWHRAPEIVLPPPAALTSGASCPLPAVPPPSAPAIPPPAIPGPALPLPSAPARPLPTNPTRDGAAHDIRTHDHARDPQRAERLLDALAVARADAAAGTPLSFALLATWQRLVLGVPEVSFRTTPAYAKHGRELYGVTPDLRTRFDACLAEAADPALPLTARAARAYLDVCFFHPFDDGNARAAFLTLVHVLARAGVSLAQVAPVRRLARRADDPEVPLELAELLAVLIRSTARRTAPAPDGPAARPWPASSAPPPPRGTA
ncbi:Fic family protein [Streptomyces sp. NPDC047072]|uniref:Fic family protein n=1 Tax=Streptomyces sp. NPDC047072 TaxID=3154809 RepID=UPI00340C7A45